MINRFYKQSKVLALMAVLFIWSASLLAQDKADLAVIYKIKKEALQNSGVQELAHELTDYIGPRLSGSSNLRRARSWSMDKFREWELANVKEDAYGEFGKGWNIKKSYVAMKTPYYQQLIATPKAWTAGTNGLVVSKVELLNITSEEDLEKYRGQLKGKIVAMPTTLEYVTNFEAEAKRYSDEELSNLEEFPIGGGRRRWTPEALAQWRAQRALNQKINDFLLKEGVALRLTGTRGSFGTVFHSAGGSYNPEAPESLPELEMSLEHYSRILRLIESGHAVEVEAEVDVEWLTDDYNGYNVYAEIPGSDKKLKSELVILGAHLDSWHAGSGANDNAAGVIAMMEAIRILKSIGIEPKRTIRIALWGEEEQGLYGSRGYVKKYVKNAETGEELPEFNKISAYYNLDNGSGKIRGIYLQGNDALRPVFERWFEPFHDLGAQTITNRNTGSTDHVAFDAVGIPGFQFIQDPIDYGRGYHTNMDVYERLMQDDIKQAAIIIASMVYHTAMRDAKLPRKE